MEAEEETEDNDTSSEQVELTKTFQIDRHAIPTLEFTEEDELAGIEGLTCYDEQVFEMGCIQQLEQHIDVKPSLGIDQLEEEDVHDRAVRLGEATFKSVSDSASMAPDIKPFDRLHESPPMSPDIKPFDRLHESPPMSPDIKPFERLHESPPMSPDIKPFERLHESPPMRRTKKKRNTEEPRYMVSDEDEDNYDFEEPSGSEYEPTDDEPSSASSDEDFVDETTNDKPQRTQRTKRKRRRLVDEWDEDQEWESSDDERRKPRKYRDRDDGDEGSFQRRVRQWEKSRADQGCFEEFHNFNFFGFKIPKEIWDKLFQYQKVGVQWLHELDETPCGGILGDEMGMGKTIQIISFLAAIHVSKIKNKHTGLAGLGPCMIVCPVTVMHQWVSEFHKWYPPIRVAVLHGSGSFSGSKTQLIKAMIRSNGVIVTSYSSLVQHLELLIVTKWHYVILDEGHTIRNPDAQVTLAAKCLRTPHRIILTGSPMQNKLQELWSLFDFVFPGRLGTLPMFMQYYGDAIVQGGYATASEAQVLAGYKCAKTLKEIISPFMLRRMKKDVMDHLKLPNKSEQVLFCKLTEEQIRHYRGYINSGDVNDILSGRLKIFVGLIKLRKICNHPDLFSGGPKLFRGDREEDLPETERFGHWSKAGKMIVLSTLLKMWHRQKHRVLLFTQSKQMLSLFEMFMREKDYKYIKMDGATNIGGRQSLIKKYNEDTSYFAMLLTTRVGGFGINLTGADRVVIYDPDWNPATDVQARERAWRIGQEKQVTVYRLITAGTIEEKMYHRQIFKQFLANRVLNDPKQRRFFKANDLMELFTLQDQQAASTETSAIFAGTGSEISLDKKKRKSRDFDLKPRKPDEIKKRKMDSKEKSATVSFSKEKVEAMKLLAQKISEKFQMGKTSENTKQSSQPNIPTNSDKDTSQEPSDVEISDIKPCKKDLLTTETNHKNTKGETSASPELVDSSSTTEKDQPGPSGLSSHTRSERDHHRKHKKKSKHKDKSLFEGERVPYLVGKEKTKKQKSEEEVKKNQDDYILQTLFSKSNICTAMKHDKIMEEGGSDYVVVENEAEEIAKKAIEALKVSRSSCHDAAAGIPTWTGSNGSFKVPTLLLDKIKKRKESFKNRSQSHRDQSSSEMFASRSKSVNSETVLIEKIVNFVSSNGNRVTSAAMVEKFRYVENAALFKALLNAVCILKKDKGTKHWTLKEEFADQS